MVNSNDVDLGLFRGQLQTQLLLHGVEKAGGRLNAIGQFREWRRMPIEHGVIRREGNAYVKFSGQPCLIHHWTVEDKRLEKSGEVSPS